MSNIEMNSYKKDDYSIGQWSGGTTTELCIYPQGSKYADRQFIWRLSSATVEPEESDFTPLPDYDRVLIVLEGETVLVHKEMRVARLAKYEQDRFSGSYETKSFGSITDFNLMVKKGCEGFAEVLTPSVEHTPLNLEECGSRYEKINQSIYCAEGFCAVSFKGGTHMLKQGELLTITYMAKDSAAAEQLEGFGIMGEGKAIRTQVFFNEDVVSPVYIKEDEQSAVSGEADKPIEKPVSVVKEENAKVTFEDLKLAALICWSNFRGGKLVFRCMKNLWFDEKLQRAVDKVEATFMTYIICLIGFTAIAFGTMELFGADAVLMGSIAWFIFDLVVINPLLYLRKLPRPVKNHIKNIKDLTEEEKIIEAKRHGENARTEKLLKKYEITGRNKYID